MELSLKGRTVLVTGASRGIGLAVAIAFAREGCHLRLVARSNDTLQQAASKVLLAGAMSCEYLELDMAARDAPARVVDRFLGVDILVNNAGDIPGGSLLELQEDRWRHSWDVKVFGYMTLTRALYPQLARSQGVVINIIGIAGELLDAEYLAGSVGNAALIAFTKAFGSASVDQGVRVVGINPGPVLTDRSINLLKARSARRGGSEDDWKELEAKYPTGRMATPEEIAHAAVFLGSSISAYTSGSILNIDAGLGSRRSIA